MTRKRILAAILIFILVLAVAGCGGDTGSSDKEDNVVVAKVNGDKITKGEFNTLYDQIKQSYMITDEMEEDPEQKDTIAQLKSEILDQLISNKIMEQKAEEAGFIVDEDVLEKAKEEYENIVKEIAAQMEAMGDEQDDGDNEDKDYVEEARKYLTDELSSVGQTVDEYINYFGKQMVLEEYIEDLLKDVDANDEDIKAYYDERLKIQKENIASIGLEDIKLYSPEGVRVKHILFKLPDDQIREYEGMMAEGREEEAKKYRDEKLKTIEPKALEVLALAKEGQSFEELIEEYGEDPGMENNDQGYVVQQDGGFVPEFEAAAFELGDGEISDLVTSDFGYHIIKQYGKVPEEEYSLEEKKVEIEEVVREQKKVSEFRTLMDLWMEEAKIKKYENRL